MSGNLYYTPGQTVTFFQEVLDANHQRTDDGYTPTITQILNPNFMPLTGYPQNMVHYDVGLWYFQFVLPRERKKHHHHHHHHFPPPTPQSGCHDGYFIGTYLVDIAYQSPDNGFIVNDKRQVIVFEPFGKFATFSPHHGHFGRAW